MKENTNKSDDVGDATPEEGGPLSTIVNSEELLADVPPQFLSGNPKRPLLHIDEDGSRYEYSLKPLLYSVLFILITSPRWRVG